MKKTKFWRRNRGFKLTPEVKLYLLIGSPVMLCNQPIETAFAGLYRCEELASQLISRHACIFLGVIILGMNKPRPRNCPLEEAKEANQK